MSTLFSFDGFEVEDVSLATGGHDQGDPIFEVGDPIQPGAKQDLLGARFGVDLRYRGDLLPTASLDLQRTTGLEGLTQVVARSLVTEPGEIFWRPDYGIGISEFLNAPGSAANIAQLKNRIRETLLELEDLDRIEELKVDLQGSLVDISIRITVAGTNTHIGLRIRGT